MSAAKRSASRASGLTHLDRRARPTMIDVGEKPITQRSAEAEAQVLLPLAVARALKRSGHRTRKGPVFDTAIIAGIMAAKRTSELIPFCHPLMLDDCRVVQRFPYTPTPGTDVNATIETLVSLRVPEHVATQLLFRLNAGNAGQPSVAQAPRRQEGLLVEGA